MKYMTAIFINELNGWIVALIILIVALYIYYKDRKTYKEKIYRIQSEAAKNTDEQIRAIREQCNKEIEHEKKICAEQIQLLQEYIETNKSEIMKKPDKEILADLTVSMSGFAKRIDRIESRLTPVEQNMALIVDKVDNIGVTVSDAQFHM